MPELWLVCEGESRSVDVDLLKAVLTDVLAAEIVVEPACGSQPSVVARFLEERRGGRGAFIRDRDYRPRAQAEAAFDDGKPGFFWRRHSIENYLLPPVVVVRAFRQLRERFEQQRPGKIPAWLHGLPLDPGRVSELLRECARLGAAEEACRIAVCRLWDALPSSIGQVQKRNPQLPSASSGGPEEWRAALLDEIERVRNAAARTAGAAQLEPSTAAAWFDAAYAEISENSYVAGLEFLVDYHGRDLLKSFYRRLKELDTRMTISFQRFTNELRLSATEEYASNRTVYGSDDFRDLANGVRSLAGLPGL